MGGLPRIQLHEAPSGDAPTIGAPSRPHRVLVVDDDEQSVRVLQRVLTSLGHEAEVARDGFEGWARLTQEIDLVLVDATMPGMDGFELTRRIREDADRGDLPIIMVTGLDSRADRLRAVEAGVNDFIAKPLEPTELRVRAASLLRMKGATDALKRHRAELEHAVERRTVELRRALDEVVAAQQTTHLAHLDTIRRLVLAAECKDRDTAGHIERIGNYCAFLGMRLGMSVEEAEVLRHASQMHDVGKIGVPDSILVKPGKLDKAEWEVMKQHTVIGARILHGSPSELLRLGEVIALSHHERWDGSGYPNGLAGDDIPLAGRICAVADVFDALTVDRPYRAALSNECAYDMMQADSGRHFDPRVLHVFLEQRDAVEEVQRAHRAEERIAQQAQRYGVR